MKIKIKQVWHDLLLCIISGVIIGLIISLISIISGLVVFQYNFVKAFILIRSVLFLCGSLLLVLGVFMWLTDSFKKNRSIMNRFNLEKQTDQNSTWNYEMESNSRVYLREKFKIFNYREVFISVATIIIVMGCMVDYLCYIY
jgi:uncharacterized protein YacL